MLRSAYSICPSSYQLGSDQAPFGPSPVRTTSSHRGAPELIATPPSINPQVDVWQVPHPGDYAGRGAANVLTKDDWAEIGALGNSTLRRRAFGMRIFLREALSGAVNDAVAPGEWRFQRTVYGKPYVANSAHSIEFSISHADTVSFLAITRSARVGIDVAARSAGNCEEIAEEFFTRAERAMLNRATAAEREETFLRIWTAKEAFAKLLGVGLAFDAPANDCGTGTHLATWTGNTPDSRVIISLAIDQPVERHAHPAPRSSEH